MYRVLHFFVNPCVQLLVLCSAFALKFCFIFYKITRTCMYVELFLFYLFILWLHVQLNHSTAQPHLHRSSSGFSSLCCGRP